jgi:DNA-binding response OmpR family regulator
MRAVVADDDRGTATIVINLLKRSNLEVAVAHDGNTAWDLLTTAPSPILAVIDWMMPGIDGLELCRRIKREPSLAHTHVILLTAKNGQQDVVAALQAGADDYIVKPFKFDELRTRVHAGIRVASLQERVATSVAELQAVHQVEGVASASSISEQARRGWLKLAKDGVARSARYRRSLGDLVQAAAEGTRQQATDADSPRDPALATGAEQGDDTLLNRSSAPIDIIDR